MVQVSQTAVHVVMETPDGAELALEPGRQVVARVVDVASDGSARISLAGQVLQVQAANANLRAGDEIRLSVAQADASAVRLAIVPSTPPPAQSIPAAMTPVATPPVAPQGGPVPTIPAGLPTAAPAAVPVPSAGATAGAVQPQPGVAPVASELAKAGVPVAPELAGTVTRIVEQLGQSAHASRAVAQLASRDLVLSPAAATRVAAALELAGSLGPALESLAARAPAVAAALPTSTPGAAALRNVLAPDLEPAELAVARIVQASSTAQAARAGGSAGANPTAVAADDAAPTVAAPPRGEAAAATRSYLTAGKVSADPLLTSVNARPDTSTLRAAQPSAGPAPLAPTTAPPLGAPATAAQQAVRASIIGTSTLPQAAAGAAETVPGAPSNAAPAAPAGSPAAGGATSAAQNPAPLPRTLLTTATAAAATGAATAVVPQTDPPVAKAVAELAVLTSRIAPSTGQASGAVADAAAAQARGVNVADVAQRAASATGVSGATNAGASASGDPAPVITAVSEFLRSGATQSNAAKLMNALRAATPQAVASALQRLPEGEVLRFAGAVLELVPDAQNLPPGVSADALRADVRGALDHLGRALRPETQPNDELAQLRTALHHVADTDARPAVAQDAQRMLAALDGQQILSRQQNGADAGYLYFQLPMPNGRGAEVLVRREPGRRTVTFEEFNIAFLLDTEQLGTLMISLDAQPSGIRADVKTDVPNLEGFLEAQSEALLEPLARESKRPVQVTVGSFDAAPPTSLLEPRLGMIEPGSREFYA